MKRNERKNETMATIKFFAIIALITVIAITAKLQEIERFIEKIDKQVPNKELLQNIKPVEKQEVKQSLVPIETRTQELVPIKNK